MLTDLIPASGLVANTRPLSQGELVSGQLTLQLIGRSTLGRTRAKLQWEVKPSNQPFDGADAPLWHAALGYEITAILGMLAIGLVFWALGAALTRRDPEPVSSRQAAS